MSYFSIHNHTDFSNIRLLDSINTPKSLIDIALKNELMGIAISDHECISGHVEFIEAYNKIKDKYHYIMEKILFKFSKITVERPLVDENKGQIS